MEGFEVEKYSSLESMVDSSNVSVLGTVESVTPGEASVETEGLETVSLLHSVDLTVVINERLAGPQVEPTVVVEFGP